MAKQALTHFPNHLAGRNQYGCLTSRLVLDPRQCHSNLTEQQLMDRLTKEGLRGDPCYGQLVRATHGRMPTKKLLRGFAVVNVADLYGLGR